jgi:hypothetical protein
MARLTSMTTVDDSPHRLLLSHLQTWASAKHRDVDVDLLDQLLELRAAYDKLEPTYWPSGSVEDLLLRLVPAKGRMEPLPAGAVVTSLESYFRFLRNTGRMAARSASPAELVKEARRSALRMRAAAEDRANWSSGKVLQDFGAQRGIPMDDAPDLETLQDRLNRIQDAWNALPIHERQRLMPHPGDRDDQSGRDRALAAYDIDEEVTALLLGFRYELPSGKLPPTTETAPIVERAGLLDRVAAMSEWIAPRIEVTATDVLRPADAHRAYEELGLRDWQRERVLLMYGDQWPPRAQQIGVDAFLDDVVDMPWRNARDCPALDRLWLAAVGCGAVLLDGRWAYPAWSRPTDPDTWVNVGVRATVSVLESELDYPSRGIGLVYALIRSYTRGCALVPWEEIVDFAIDWHRSPDERRRYAEYGVDERSSEHRLLRSACHFMQDTGVFVTNDDGLTLTPFGDVFVTAWLKYRERPSR